MGLIGIAISIFFWCTVIKVIGGMFVPRGIPTMKEEDRDLLNKYDAWVKGENK